MADNQVKYKYTDELTGKVWANENKSSASDPDFKGTLCEVGDVQKVTKTVDGKKSIDWNKIPGSRKKAISIWKNDGTLNIKIAKREEASSSDDDPFNW